MKRKKIFLGIAFGTSVRDVLRNDTFKILKNQPNLDIVVFAQDIESPTMKEISGPNIFFEKLLNYKPDFAERILLQLHRATLREKCRTIDLGNTAGDTKPMDRLTPLANLLKKVFGYKKTNKIIFWLYKIFTKPKLYKDVFDKHKPNLVLVTRVLNYSLDYPLLRRAVAEKIPVISLVSSWDNLTSKAFFPFSIDSIVVWNNVLKNEAIDLFDFPDEKIFVSGIPRYDLLFKRTGFGSKENFFKTLNLDLNKKLIIYGTGSQQTGRTSIDNISPEPEIVTFIADAIRDKKIEKPVQLMVRLHPQAAPSEYEELMNRQDVLVHIPGKLTSFQDRLFSEQDDIELGESMLYADVVINLASTVTIDAAVFDTPIICIGFDYRGHRPFMASVKRLYEFDHYAKLKTTGGFDLAESKEQLIHQINNNLNNPNHLSLNRKKIVDQQCVFTDGKSGERVANYILKKLESL